MKIHAMKKVLSLVFVIAILMSVCSVALVGTTSAAETYTLNVNGNTETDKDDRLGMIVGSGTQSDNFSYTSGLRFTERTTDGFPRLLTNQSHNFAPVDGEIHIIGSGHGTGVGMVIGSQVFYFQ